MPVRMNFGNWTNFLKIIGYKPLKFIPTQNGITRKGTRNINRKIIDLLGYETVFEPLHPVAMKNGYARVHRMVAYDTGFLKDLTLEVHHKNGIKTDNRLENLEVMSKVEHAKITTPLGSKRPRRKPKINQLQ